MDPLPAQPPDDSSQRRSDQPTPLASDAETLIRQTPKPTGPTRPTAPVSPTAPTAPLDKTVVRPNAQAGKTKEETLADPLLQSAPRSLYQEKQFPTLGGIPLLSKLGQGGMGAVYYGMHPRLQQEVAVKVLPFPLVAQQPQMVERFYREARIAAKVKSPHLVGVLDVNEESGLFYLVMDFVSGVSAGAYLRKLLAERSKVEEATALDICIAATQGLAAAHAEHVIHRDIKPDNIMIPRARNEDALLFAQAKLADLGLARSEDMNGQSLTGAQTAMGTPGYMAPEQALDAKTVRAPGDVFSMGATLYALLSGHAPFRGSTTTKTILDTLQNPHVPIRNLRPTTTVATETLIDRCLQKHPTSRFADANALLEGLKACRAGLEKSAAPRGRGELAAAFAPTITGPRPASPASPVSPSSARTVLSATPASRTMKPVRNTNVSYKAGLAGGVLVLGAVVAFVLGAGRDDEFGRLRDETVKSGQTGLKNSGPELERQVSLLEAFLEQHASHKNAELLPVTQLRDKLKQRQDQLALRQEKFGALVREAERLADSNPSLGLEKLGEAEQTGEPNSTDSLPDLRAGLAPGLAARLKALQKTLADAAAAKAAATPASAPTGTPAAKEDPSEVQYLKAMLRAKDAFNEKKFEAAELAYQEAVNLKPNETEAKEGLAKAGEAKRKAESETAAANESESEPKTEAKAKPATPPEESKEKVEGKSEVELKIKEAEAFLERKAYDEAKNKFKEVMTIDADLRNDPRVKKGMEEIYSHMLIENVGSAASAADSEDEGRFKGAMNAAKMAFEARRYSEAAMHYRHALHDKPGDAEAEEGLSKAMKAMKESGTTSDEGTGGDEPPPPPRSGRRPTGR